VSSSLQGSTQKYPGIDPPNARPFQDRSGSWKLLQIGVERVGILAEFNEQASRAKLQISFLQVVEEPMEGVVI
jgi:hypothetical protein